jgi:leucine dehydrogenase
MLFDHPHYDAHEKIVFCQDTSSGMRAIIAIHSTRLGPAAGGCRLFPYQSDQEALADVLRLSRGMTYKNAMAGLALGGGKSVIIATAGKPLQDDLLLAFGRQVEALSGTYWTAEDIGIDVERVELIAQATQFVFGTRSRQQAAGDPSRFTAAGVFAGLRAAVQHKLGLSRVRDLKIAVQGVGSVGWELCRILSAHGAQLIVADPRPSAVSKACAEFGATSSEPSEIHRVAADVFSPCAIGGTLNSRTIGQMRASIVAGSANNQLATESDGVSLHQKGILYAPDFIINAGGMLHASGEIFGKSNPKEVDQSIERIFQTTLNILEHSKHTQIPPEVIAVSLAVDRINNGVSSPVDLQAPN